MGERNGHAFLFLLSLLRRTVASFIHLLQHAATPSTTATCSITPAYVSQHTSAYVSIRQTAARCHTVHHLYLQYTAGIRQSAYVSIRQSAYVSLRPHPLAATRCHTVHHLYLQYNASIRQSAYVSIRQAAYVRQHTSVYVSIRQSAYVSPHTSAYVQYNVSIRQSAYVSIRPHTSAYVSIRQLLLLL
jgi:hypothetical protein